MKYKFFEDLATADIAFEAEGSDLNELFEACALATFDIMVDLKSVNPKVRKIINLDEKNTEDLLFAFIEELIYLKDVETMLFSKFKIKVIGNSLEAEIYGEKINQKEHRLKIDIKAITLHKFEVKKVKNKWIARVIVDI